ncbi:gamma-glutamyltransferase [Pseudomonas sp. PMCC200344]|uniref:gamma-glutamyltransferase n=1 Tax=Pseudomonas sp. PMCC200344 TaxID=3042028 RepID=UPI0024B35ABF|nr:gamma-glutamyltransferase [Pseudomonas sp. PMCC200344]
MRKEYFSDSHRKFALLCAVLLASFLSVGNAQATSGNTVKSHLLTHSAVAVPDRYAAETARAIFAKGGNAIDAAVAIAFTLAVTYPEAGNIGGGGFMTIYHEGKPYFLDYRERAPLKATKDMFVAGNGRVIPADSTQSSVLGHKAVGVPGTVAGLWEAHQRLGKLSWQALVAPAIRYADAGFQVDEMLAGLAATENKQRFAGKTNFSEHFGTLQSGKIFKQPELAAVLKRIAKRGAAGFYSGKTAELIVADMAEHGGLISEADLRNYKAIWREPIQANWNGFQVVTAPPPSSGGIALVQLLKMKEARNADFSGVPLNSPEYIHLVAEIEKRVFADRAQYLGDPDFYKVPVRQLLDENYLLRRAAEVSVAAPSDTSKVVAGLKITFPEKPETTHFSIVDKWGNAVSNTYTLNGFFGSGVVANKTGILLNDEMDDFSALAGVPNQLGVVGNDTNAIEPGKRPLSSMSPTIFLKDGKVALVIGTPGGPRIFTSIFQVVSNIYDFKLPLKNAVSAMRFHHQLLPANTIFWEPYSPITGQLARDLGAKGYNLVNQGFNGDIQAIKVNGGIPEPVTDPRGRGVTMLVK